MHSIICLIFYEIIIEVKWLITYLIITAFNLWHALYSSLFIQKFSYIEVYVNNEQEGIRDRDRLWITSDKVTCIKYKHKFLITIIYIYIYILQNKTEFFIKVNP